MVAASAVPIIAAGITAAGAAVSAVGAIRQGQAAKNAAEFEAEVALQQAAQERSASRQEEEDFRRDQAALFAARRARLGGSGVQIGVGSPLLASEDFASEVELQARRIRTGGERRATRLDQKASLLEASGKNAQTGSFFRSGSLLLSGAGKAASMWPSS